MANGQYDSDGLQYLSKCGQSYDRHIDLVFYSQDLRAVCLFLRWFQLCSLSASLLLWFSCLLLSSFSSALSSVYFGVECCATESITSTFLSPGLLWFNYSFIAPTL